MQRRLYADIQQRSAYMGDRLREVENVDFYTMMFTTEGTEEKLKALNAVKNKSKIDGGHTRGLYYKGVL